MAGGHDHARDAATAIVALRKSDALPAHGCFHKLRQLDAAGLTVALVSSTGGSLVGVVACSQPPAARLSKHYVARGSLVLRLAKQQRFGLNANPEPRRLPHHREDAAVSRGRGDEWSSSRAEAHSRRRH